MYQQVPPFDRRYFGGLLPDLNAISTNNWCSVHTGCPRKIDRGFIIYTYDKNLENIAYKLENDCSVALEWLANNFMKLNADKCHLLVIGERWDDPFAAKIGNAEAVNSSKEKLLGVHIDSKLSFDHHVSKLCQKTSNNLMHLSAYPCIWIITN